jgi:UBA/TS-N domain
MSPRVEVLLGLGFPVSECEVALRQAKGDVERAAMLLLSGDVTESSDMPPLEPVDAYIQTKPSGDGHDWQCETCTFMNYR